MIEINLRCEDSTMGVQQKGTVLLAFTGRVEVKFIDVFICSFIHSTNIFGCQGLGGREKVELLFKGIKFQFCK